MSDIGKDRIVIVGAGVSGLRTASLLCEKGVPCVVLDARSVVGGRAATHVSAAAGNASFDLGPTWFWPNAQPRISALVRELGLATFDQYADGSAWVERFRLEKAQRYALRDGAAAPARRFNGGVRSLVASLWATLPPGTVQLERQVLSVDCRQTQVEVLVRAGGARERLHCRGVVLALPPRAIASRILLRPGLPDTLRDQFSRTPTWLGGQAKAIAVYEAPFWREQGHSGLVSSLIGPLQEIHDASPESGVGALFGFFGLSPAARHRLGAEELCTLVLTQLTRLFGERAARPLDYIYKDWAEEPHIVSPADLELANGYLEPGLPRELDEPWHGRLLFAGTELALEQRGYLEGALESAERAATRVLDQLGAKR